MKNNIHANLLFADELLKEGYITNPLDYIKIIENSFRAQAAWNAYLYLKGYRKWK
jgi:hypothetical protein